MAWENITYQETLSRFKKDLGIKGEDARSVEWQIIKESASAHLVETLFTTMTKFQFRGEFHTPLEYLLSFRKHSLEAILHFQVGFHSGSLMTYLESKGWKRDVLKSIGLVNDKGLCFVPENCFTYPAIMNGQIDHFRFKDPNKIKRFQMPSKYRSNKLYFYNQDAISGSKEIFLTEGEDDCISLWQAGVHSIATTGGMQLNQVRYLNKFDFETIFLVFDNDTAGERDTEVFVKMTSSNNVFIIPLPSNKSDIDEVLRESEDKRKKIEELREQASFPSIEFKTNIRQKSDGYFAMRKDSEKRLTNWTLSLQAICQSKDEDKIYWRVLFKSEKGETNIEIPAEAFSNTSLLRNYLLSNIPGQILYFKGSDSDLSELIHFLSANSNPKNIIEMHCVGDTEYGFLAENLVLTPNNEIKPLNNTYLTLDENTSIKIVPLVRRGGNKSEIPYYHLNEPVGGIFKFKKKLYDLMIQNRNLKIALAIGWAKATLWSSMFYEQKKFFPLLCLHGKYQCGKTVLSNWLMSILGIENCNPEMLSDKGTTEVGLARKLSFYSSLPVFADDYRSDDTGLKFHTFMRGVYDRTSPTKGLRNEDGVRRVIIRGCLMLTGEHSPTDPALLNRMVSIELSRKERNDIYFKDIVRLQKYFSCIGLDWLKSRQSEFPHFFKNFEKFEDQFTKDFDDPRQASVFAVVVASAISEGLWEPEEIIDFAKHICKSDLAERRSEDTINTLWEAVEILFARNELVDQELCVEALNSRILVHLPGLLGRIRSSPACRHYTLPNKREIVKLLKQEPYLGGYESIRVNGKVGWRWIIKLDSPELPDALKNISDRFDPGLGGSDAF
jgi:5S rRNA maturation endonuclease (ribonuclease M5)